MKKRNIINLIITILLILVSYYIFLPPLNFTAPEFWYFLFIMLGFYLLISFISLGLFVSNYGHISTLKLSSGYKILLSIIPIGIVLILIINFILSPIFNSGAYASRIIINQNANFQEEIKPVDFSQVPLLDKDSTQKIGDRVMGEMTDLVSQFKVSNLNLICAIIYLTYFILSTFYHNNFLMSLTNYQPLIYSKNSSISISLNTTIPCSFNNLHVIPSPLTKV